MSVLALTAATALGLMSGSPAAADTAVAGTTISSATAGDALAYWTPERMAGARPYDVRPPARGGGSMREVSAAPGKALSVPPTAGSLGGNEAVPSAATTVARPYTDLPDRLNVKIFFTQAGGGNFVCSGTIVNSTTKRMIATAGHCVSDGQGHFHRNVVVVPGFASACDGCNDAPFGRWSARTLTVTDEWHNLSNFKQDVGYVVVNDLAGQRIVRRLGGQGVRFNVTRAQRFRSYGYPAATPFNGFNQFVCPSSRLADDNPGTGRGQLTIRISCNMTGGSSGGGWIVNESSNGLGFVNSVNSYKYVSGPKANVNHMYGPYFGNEALNLYDFTVRQG
jgi:hypothetical protein